MSNSRPSTPTYFVLGALVLKDLFDLTDEELEDRIAFCLISNTRLGLFPLTISRSTGELSIAFAQRITCTSGKLTSMIAQFMDKIADALKSKHLGMNWKRRMDSVMIDNGCRKLSTLQLAHVINKNVLFLLDEHQIFISDELYHYIEDFDENKVTSLHTASF